MPFCWVGRKKEAWQRRGLRCSRSYPSLLSRMLTYHQAAWQRDEWKSGDTFALSGFRGGVLDPSCALPAPHRQDDPAPRVNWLSVGNVHVCFEMLSLESVRMDHTPNSPSKSWGLDPSRSYVSGEYSPRTKEGPPNFSTRDSQLCGLPLRGFMGRPHGDPQSLNNHPPKSQKPSPKVSKTSPQSLRNHPPRSQKPSPLAGPRLRCRAVTRSPGDLPGLGGGSEWAVFREFTKGGLVKGGLAIRHVFNFHIKNGT